MKKLKQIGTSALLLALVIFSDSERTVQHQVVDFQKELGTLLHTVQLSGLFTDSKTFVDLPLKASPQDIMKAFHEQKDNYNFNPGKFVNTYFDTLYYKNQTVYIKDPDDSITEHIDTLWTILKRYPAEDIRYSSLLPLDHPYIVPGGRFREIYYWDSYFTMLGLVEGKRFDILKSMINNFTDMISTYGHIPNGNRSYYLSRSQPPFYALMVQLLSETDTSVSISEYLPELVKEYDFWIKDTEKLGGDVLTSARVVLTDNGNILNRYWDNSLTPRPESYLPDVRLFLESGRDSAIFRDLRAAAESGWDFSSRWFEDCSSLGRIITTQIIPVDLNCLLYNLETTISEAYLEENDSINFRKYAKLAAKRAVSVNSIFWNEKTGFYHDYNFIKKEHTPVFSLAALYPLFFGISDSLQAAAVAKRVADEFLCEYGLVTTLTQPATGEQWDYPNGWAPLQWIAFIGLRNYGYDSLANEIAFRWMNIVELIYYSTAPGGGKLLEKYNVVNGMEGKGGEYPLQDGFGWTNGVFLKLKKSSHSVSESIINPVLNIHIKNRINQ